MIQVLLHGMKMDPIVSLHYYAPVCALINLCMLPFTEGLAPFYELARVGPLILLSNAFVAFLLNVAAVFLVGVGSGLVLTLAGVFKVRLLFFSIGCKHADWALQDILLISGSVLLFGSTITPVQIFGELSPSLYPSSLCSSCIRLFHRAGRSSIIQDIWW